MPRTQRLRQRAGRLGWLLLKHGLGIDLPARLLRLTVKENLAVLGQLDSPATPPVTTSFAALGLAEAEIKAMHRRSASVFYLAAGGALLCLGLLASQWLRGNLLAGLGSLGGLLIGLSLGLKYSLISAQLRTRTLLTGRAWLAHPALWLPHWRM